MLSYLPAINYEQSFIKKQMDYFRLQMQKNDDKNSEDSQDKNPVTPPKGFEKFFKKREEEKKAAQKQEGSTDAKE